jgi:hypothetical protein
MASTYSTDLKLELIATGEQSGTWGVTTNTNIGTLIEEAIAREGAATFTSDANLTLSMSDGATSVARCAYLNCTSSVSLTATRDLIVPTINKPYIVLNATSGSQSIRVKTSAGTGITIPNGKTMLLYADGTNVVNQLDNLPSGTQVNGLTIVDLSSTQTLTNKTLTAPVISTISNTGTVTLPTSTDTLVGRATTDTLTNKTLTSPVISGGTINNAPIGGTTPAAGAFTTLSATTPLPITSGGTGLATANLLVQRVVSTTTAHDTTTASIPVDNTIPQQSTEGEQITTVAITPKSGSNTLRISVSGMFSNSAATGVVLALFVDSTEDAIYATFIGIDLADNPQTVSFSHTLSAGSTSARTYKLFYGRQTTGTAAYNGGSGGQLFGGRAQVVLQVEEFTP